MNDHSCPANVEAERRPPVRLGLRLLVEAALAGHLAVGAAWWYLSPKGFPFGHSRGAGEEMGWEVRHSLPPR